MSIKTKWPKPIGTVETVRFAFDDDPCPYKHFWFKLPIGQIAPPCYKRSSCICCMCCRIIRFGAVVDTKDPFCSSPLSLSFMTTFSTGTRVETLVWRVHSVFFLKIYLFSKVTRIPPSEIRRPVNTCRFFSFKTPIVFQSDVTDFTFIFFSTDEFDFWNKKRGASDRICLKRMRLGWVSSIYLIWQSEVWVRCESEKEILLSCHVVELSTALEMRLLKEEKEYILITKEE